MKKILILMLTTSMILSGCSSSPSLGSGDLGEDITTWSDDNLGNTSSNISNGVLVAKDGEYIYYPEAMDNQYDLVRADKKLENKQQVKGIHGFWNIRVIGEWIYAVSEEGIHRFKKDGSSKEKIIDAGFFVNDGNKWMYVAISDPGEEGIYKVNIDTKETMKLSSDLIFPLGSLGLSFDGQWVYYVSGSTEGRIYRMKSDGSQRENISEPMMGHMVVEGDWIYYVNGPLYKMKKDGTGVTMVFENVEDDTLLLIKEINVSEDWVYIIAQSFGGADIKIIKFRTDGSDKTVVLEDDGRIMNLNVIDDYIYYLNHKGTLWRIKNDGTNKEVVSELRT